jgi:hypothetical protein
MYRQCANANATFFNRHDCAVFEVIAEAWQIAKNYLNLGRGEAKRRPAKQNEGRLGRVSGCQ